MLIASTSEVYGKSTSVPFREDADLVLGPTSKHRWAYACSKMIDRVPGAGLLEGAEAARHRGAALQYRRAPADRSVRDGRAQFRAQALTGQPITVFGDGSQSRSFTYVGDVVRAMVALINEPKAIGQVFNGVGNEFVDVDR